LKKQSNLSRLLQYAGGYKSLTYASWIFSSISALIALVPFWYIWKIIKEVLEVSPNFKLAENLTHNGWMAVLFAVLSVLVYIAGLMCSHLSAFRIATNIRIRLTDYITTLPLGSVETFGSGRLRRIIAETSGQAETYLAHQLPDKAKAIATTAGLLVLLLVFDWRLGLLSLVPVALGFFIMSKMTGKSMQQKITEYQNALTDMSNEAVEYVRGIPVVKTFGQTVFSFKRFKKTIEAYETWAIAYTKELRLPMMFYTLAINSVFIFLIAAGIIFTRKGVDSEFLLNLIFYIVITPVISLTLTKMMRQSENEMMVTDALQRIDSVLEMEPLQVKGKTLHPKDASVELMDVSFSYDGNKDVLKDISLSIKSGQTVAFVGPSGGGKTTLASIIARFFDPKKGQIRIGGVDVKSIAKEELMDTVSFVFQDSRLIKASILENVKMGKPSATREEVIKVLEAAQCMDIMKKFPQGVDTVLGSKGVYLSGGEQQRIAIARAMLKDAPIIILDEATAFADPDNENRVQAALSKLAENKTVIMIAHRLSTVVGVDTIYVLKDGKIVEKGNCKELLSQKGLFYDMWNNYKCSVEWKVAKEA
jgi:ATP-binding cassette subfamily B protein IrtA